jgi:hypothetical protein
VTPDDFYDDANLCTATYPGDDNHTGQLCHEQAGHDGDHRALGEVGPGWRRHITWPNTGSPQ